MLSHVQLFATHGLHMPPSPSFTVCWSLLKLMSIQSVMLSNHLILCRPLLLLPSVFRSITIFSNEPTLHIRWPKCWSFSFSISLSNEYSGLIYFRMDWFDLLAIQGTYPSTWLLKCPCSELCTCVDGRKEEVNTFPAWDLPFWEILARLNGLFILLPHFPHLWYKRTWHPDLDR